MSKKTIGKNVAYNMVYQLLAIIVPLITSPYLSRVLGVEQIGIDSFTNSITTYFVIFAVLGINNYGNRSIATAKASGEDLGALFSSIYGVQFLTASLVTICYLVYLKFAHPMYLLIAFLQIFHILANMFDITWFFYGIEEFRVTVFRNSMVKLLSLVAIFLFVKQPSDLWKYTLIISGTALLGQLTVWPFLFKEVKLVLPKIKDMKTHIQPILLLFIPVLAISVFTNMDKFMIGQLSNVTQSGYYENAVKIIGIPKSLIAALGTVMLPRTTSLISAGDEEKSHRYIELTLQFILFIGTPLMFGLMAVADIFSLVFWGAEFLPSGTLIVWLAPSFLLSIIGNVVRTQYLIPRSRDKEYIMSLVAGAIVNFAVNLTLIPSLGAKGAVIGTLVAEFVMTALQIYSTKKEVSVVSYLMAGKIFVLSGFMMYVFTYSIKGILGNYSSSVLIFLIMIGVVSYCVFVILLSLFSQNQFIVEQTHMILKKMKLK